MNRIIVRDLREIRELGIVVLGGLLLLPSSN